jgi:hypothetical protein
MPSGSLSSNSATGVNRSAAAIARRSAVSMSSTAQPHHDACRRQSVPVRYSGPAKDVQLLVAADVALAALDTSQ